MADASVLKDFLVSVHWDISEAEFKKAIATVGQFTQQIKLLDKGHDDLSKKAKSTWTEFAKQVGEFGQKALVAGVAIEQMVKRQTEMFENLFFLSQRTGASVQNLINFSQAAGAIGTSANSAKAAIVSMTQAIKLDPSAAAAWRALGINPHEDPTRLLPDLAKRLRGMNPRLQHMYAERTGTPWEPLEAAIKAGGAERLTNQQARITGVDRSMNLTQEKLDKLAEDVVKFYGDVAVLNHAFEDITKVSLIALLPILDELVNVLTPLVTAIGKINSGLGGWPVAIIEVYAGYKALSVALGVAKRALTLLTGAELAGGAGGAAAGAARGGFAKWGIYGLAAGGLYEAGKTILHPESRDKSADELSKGMPFNTKWIDPFYLLGRALQAGGEGSDRTQLGPQRHMAAGGIVPINAHAGEIVLPAGLSRALLGMVNSLQNSDTNETFTSAKRSAESLISWIGGMIAPHVTIANFQDLIDKQLLLGVGGGGDVTGGDGGAARPGGAGKGNVGGAGRGGVETPSTPAGPGGTVSDQKNYSAIAVNEMRKAGWSEAAIKATLGTVLGEGGWREAWKQSSAMLHGKREESYGPYQFFKGGELPGYLQWAKANNIENPQQDVAAQTRYFIKRAGEMTHGRFGQSTNVDVARRSISGTWHGAMSATAGQIEQQYNTAMSGIQGAPQTPSGGDPKAQIPIGSGLIGGKFSATRNMGTINKALIETLSAASKLLPEGWRLESTSGHEAGHAGDLRHHYGTALDVRLVGPGGRLPNRGDAGPNDPYTKFATLWHSKVAQMYPGLEKIARWGGEFHDKMHFDFDFSGRPIPRRRHDWTGGDVNASNNSTQIYNITAPGPHEAAQKVERLHKRQAQIHLRNMRTHVG